MLTTMFDNPLRITVVDVDGKTNVIDAVSMTIEGTPPRARGRDALAGKTDKTDEPVPTKGSRVFAPSPRTEAEIKAALGGKLDDVENTKERIKDTVEIVCAMRVRVFKLTTCVYNVRDAQVISSALANGVKPSDLLRAVVVAALDPFWQQQGDMRPDQIVKHVAALSAKYDRETRRHRVTNALRKLDPVAADALVAALDAAARGGAAERTAAAAALDAAEARVAASKVKP